MIICLENNEIEQIASLWTRSALALPDYAVRAYVGLSVCFRRGDTKALLPPPPDLLARRP
jgi:hypothetical protein